jgi:LysM repeat protein
VGTTPLTVTPQGASIQGLAASAGVDWKTVAAANGIDNPRAVQAGTVVNLSVGS